MRIPATYDLVPALFLSAGSVTECQYKLQGYGIPGDQLPIKSSELIKTQNHSTWVDYCVAKEAAFLNQQPFLGVYCPLPADVIAGRGPHASNHPGNIAYRELLESKLETYDAASGTEEKIYITLDVVLEIWAMGGRFLTKDPHGDWLVPITDEETARMKVSVAFRDVRKTIKANSNRKKVKSAAWNAAASSNRKGHCGCGGDGGNDSGAGGGGLMG